MPVTSHLLEPGTPAPDFALLNPVDGRIVRREEFRGRPGLLVMFLSNECPFVRHVLAEVSALTRDYEKRGVGIVAINSNDAAMYPHEAPSFMKVLAEREGWAFPYLVDSTQEVAIAFGAVCTPEFF
ncbi:redoxin domain-containing protein, partial [Hyalangium sp.]|uniref:redoxin domain-containing protein n=1 Tax=Hyalangium sp. TaxID=2028555 RepID=UPI002D749D4F